MIRHPTYLSKMTLRTTHKDASSTITETEISNPMAENNATEIKVS
jgi:hypothetical protein